MPESSLNPSLREIKRAIAAQEQSGDSAGLLELLATSPSLPVRRSVAQALYRIARRPEVLPLLEILAQEQDKATIIILLDTFGRLGADEALPPLIQALKHKEAQIRMTAADALSRYNSEQAFQVLLDALKQNKDEQDRFVRQFAAEGLGKLGDRRAFTALVNSLNDPSDLVRPAAATALGRLGDRRAVPYLVRVRHKTSHPRGVDCAECRAIDTALEQLKPVKDS
jgi:HEAT repeat protein